jgi:hypothetical protein
MGAAMQNIVAGAAGRCYGQRDLVVVVNAGLYDSPLQGAESLRNRRHARPAAMAHASSRARAGGSAALCYSALHKLCCRKTRSPRGTTE